MFFCYVIRNPVGLDRLVLQNVYDDDMLTQLSTAVSSLYLWPNPVGKYAAETLHLIAREQRSPGRQQAVT